MGWMNGTCDKDKWGMIVNFPLLVTPVGGGGWVRLAYLV